MPRMRPSAATIRPSLRTLVAVGCALAAVAGLAGCDRQVHQGSPRYAHPGMSEQTGAGMLTTEGAGVTRWDMR